jgi:hypothetical protein
MFDYCNDDWWTSQHEDPSWEHIFLCQALDSYPDQTGNLQLGIRVLQEVKGTMQNHLERKPFVVVRYGDEMGWDGSIQNLPQIELMNMPKCQPFWQLAKKLWMWTAGLWFWLISIYIYISISWSPIIATVYKRADVVYKRADVALSRFHLADVENLGDVADRCI